jgi:hypothetical protein
MSSPLFSISQFIIHEARGSTGLLRVNEARDALGEAYTEAIMGGFLVPCRDDGELRVTQDTEKLALLQAAYEDVPILEPGDKVTVGAHPAVVINRGDDGTYTVQLENTKHSTEKKALARDQMKLTKRPKASKKIHALWGYQDNPANNAFDWGG